MIYILKRHFGSEASGDHLTDIAAFVDKSQAESLAELLNNAVASDEDPKQLVQEFNQLFPYYTFDEHDFCMFDYQVHELKLVQ